MAQDPLELYRLLKSRLPEYVTHGDTLNLKMLAVELDRTRQALHKAICSKGYVSPDVARALIKASKGRLKAEEILPFIN